MSEDLAQNEVFMPKINAVAQDFINELMEEANALPEGFPLITKIIEDAIDRVYAIGRIPGRELHADVFKQKPIKLAQNVHLPVKLYPHFNFKGKILGPKGNTLKRLHQETMCNIAIKGRNSMRDPEKEEALRQSANSACNHLNKPLHVEITTVAPPAEAYARMAYCLKEIRKYIIPDTNDEVSQEQYRELQEMNPENVRKAPEQRSIFAKLAQIKDGGYGGRSTNTRYDDTPSNSSSYEQKPYVNARAPAPSTPSFLERVRELRTKPYQKYSPFKK